MQERDKVLKGLKGQFDVSVGGDRYFAGIKLGFGWNYPVQWCPPRDNCILLVKALMHENDIRVS